MEYHPRPICAHWSTSSELETDQDILASIELARQAQKARLERPGIRRSIRQGTSNTLQQVQLVVRRKTQRLSNSLQHRRPDQQRPQQQARPASFDSSSTLQQQIDIDNLRHAIKQESDLVEFQQKLQRQFEFADLQKWQQLPGAALDSPVSPYNKVEEKRDNQRSASAPPFRVLTLKQERKDAKRQAKEDKELDKLRKKQQRVAFEISVAESRRVNGTLPSTLPTSSENESSDSRKHGIRNLAKKLTSKRPLNKLKAKKHADAEPPHCEQPRTAEVDKEGVPAPDIPVVAELPATLPPYTSFQSQNLPPTENNSNPNFPDEGEHKTAPGVAIDEQSQSTTDEAQPPTSTSALGQLAPQVGTTTASDDATKRELQKWMEKQLANVKKERHAAQDRDFALKERDLAVREREMTLQERQTAMQERQRLDNDRKDCLEIARQYSGKAVGFGAQFATPDAKVDEPGNSKDKEKSISRSSSIDLAEGSPEKFRAAVAQVLEGAVPRILLHDPKARTCPAKRKVEGHQTFGSVSSHTSSGSGKNTSSGRPPLKPQRSNEDDEEEGHGSPKRLKQESPPGSMSQRLLACPYHKQDSLRYSERNNYEKHYRGCASGYWTDISRLKQHLYRVHRRPLLHCARCFSVFKTKALLDQHSRLAIQCEVQQCPFEEKFDEDQYCEIHRKRPTLTTELQWFAIFDVLFPGIPRPETAYADEPSPQQSPAATIADPQAPQMLQAILNTRLNQHQNTPEHAWVRSREARDLINRELAQSMAEMLRMMSNTPLGAAPPIFVSPTSQSTSALATSTSQTPFSSAPVSPIDGQKHHLSAPWLSANQAYPSRRESLTPIMSEPAPASPEADLGSRQFPQTSAFPSASPFNVHVPSFAPIGPVDDGYDQESGSWHEGDELDITEMIPPAPSYRALKNPSRHPSPAISTAPRLKITSLSNEPQAHITPAELNKHGSNKTHDSGYGSRGSSLHQPRQHDEPAVPDVAIADVDLPDYGHESFFEQGMQGIEAINEVVQEFGYNPTGYSSAFGT